MTLTWSRKRTLVAGLVLIALTNAVALGGVAWNRSGTPESELKLSQRELWDAYRSRYDSDAGGAELNLRWRTLAADTDSLYYGYFSGPAEWLDQAKLAELGFDVRPLDPARAGRRDARFLPREALIVLELDGPAAKAALERVRARAAQEAAKAAAEADNAKPELKNRAKMAAEALRNEETSNTRLFAVDAGRDAAALRAKYPDRSRYAIVRGKIRAHAPYGRGAERQWRGYIESLDSPRINVPLEFRRQAGLPLRIAPADSKESGPRFEVTVAFGKRFEPWVTALAVTK